MARYPLISYRYDVPLPTGRVETRIHCPNCAGLHYDIWEGEERFCFGCGKILTVFGLELVALDVPGDYYDDEYHGDNPDNPGFWYNVDN